MAGFVVQPTKQTSDSASVDTDVEKPSQRSTASWFATWFLGLHRLLDWNEYDLFHQSAEVLFVFGILMLILYAMLDFVYRIACAHFFARRLFSTRTTVRFTSQAIQWTSRLYERPVVVWRRWNNLPVRCRFIVQQDRQARHFQEANPQLCTGLGSHILEASRIEAVISSGHQGNFEYDANFQSCLRSLPITEVPADRAGNLVTVFAAAAALTNAQEATHSGPEKSDSPGVDIDLQ